MAIDSSPKAAPIRQCNAISIPSVVGTNKKKKSLLDAIMDNIASSKDDRLGSDGGDGSDFAPAVPVSIRPQEGSLAAALGMAVDTRSTAATVRMASDFPTGSNEHLTKKTLFDAAV
jgi:hypothetical protein